MKSKTLQAIVEIAGTLSPTLGKSIEEATGKLDGINVKALAAGAAVGGIAIATGAAVIKAGSYLAELGDDFKQTMNQLSAATGATGDELGELGDIVKDVYANGMGESLADVADGLAAVKQATGAVGDELEAATNASYLLSDTFGFGIDESARTAATLMKNFNMTAEEAYNTIALGAQNGANKNGDLLDTLNEYSGQYAALGLSSDQFIDSLISGANEGLWSIDKVGDAVKEFNIRAKDGSKTSTEAFQSLGMDADKMFASFAAGGDSAEAAFFETVKALEAIEDPMQKNAVGVALFGTQFEDLESGVLPVLAGIEDAAYNGTAALDQMNAVKYDDLGSAMEQIKRTAEVGLLPLATTVANALTGIMPIVAETMEDLMPVIDELTVTLTPLIQDLFASVAPVLKRVIPMIAQIGGELLNKLIPPLLKIYTSIMPVMMQLLEALMPILDVIISLLGPILSLFTKLLQPILSLISEAIAPLILVLAQLINTALQPLGPIIEWLSGIFTGVLGSAMDAVRPIIDAVTKVFGNLIDFIKNVFAGNWSGAWENIVGIFSGIFEGIKALFMAPFKYIIGGINSFIKGINKIQIPDWVPLVGGKGINIPLIPTFAAGGFTDGMSIAGEAGMEAVISFLPQFRKENIEYWKEAGKMLGVIDKSQPIVVSLDGIAAFASGGFTNGLSIAGEAGQEAIISFDPSHRDENIGYWAAAGKLLGLDDFSLGSLTEAMVVNNYFSWSPHIEATGYSEAQKEDLIARLKEQQFEFFDWLEGWLLRKDIGSFARHAII